MSLVVNFALIFQADYHISFQSYMSEIKKNCLSSITNAALNIYILN